MIIRDKLYHKKLSFAACVSAHIPAIELDSLYQFSSVFGPYWGLKYGISKTFGTLEHLELLELLRTFWKPDTCPRIPQVIKCFQVAIGPT